MPTDWEPTRATLHAYAHAVSMLPRVHAQVHPKWWHISLKVRPNGLTTESFPLPGGGTAFAFMDLRNHEIVLETSHGESRTFSMTQGLTATEMGGALIKAASEFGLEGDYAREKFESDNVREYHPADATTFLVALVAADRALTTHRDRIGGEVGPVQLWPHGFDLAFEWFGTKTVSHEENGEMIEQSSQINFGFYPAGDAYFYSSPWPFDRESLLAVELPPGARWNTDGWEGSVLEYAEVTDQPDGVEQFLEYVAAVHDAAAPLLTR